MAKKDNLEKIISVGEEELFEEFLNDSDDILFIESNEGADEITDFFVSYFGEKKFSAEFNENSNAVEIEFQNKRKVIDFYRFKRPNWFIAAEIENMINDKYELRVVESSIQSDTHLLLLRPKIWWENAEYLNKDFINRKFVSFQKYLSMIVFDGADEVGKIPVVKIDKAAMKKIKEEKGKSKEKIDPELKKYLKMLDEWVKKNYNYMVVQSKPEALKPVKFNDIQSLIEAKGSLWYIWSWYEMEGARQLLRNDADGWMNIKYATILYYLGFRISVFIDRKPEGRRNEAMLYAAALYLLGEEKKFQTLMEMIEKKTNEQFNPKNTLIEFLVEGMALMLAGKDSEFADFVSKVSPSSYKDIFKYWEGDDERLTKAFEAACQDHWNMRYEKRRKEYKYDELNEPFDILPFEIFALLKVRKQCGLSIPKINHFLMNTPIPPVPEKPIEINDSFFKKMVDLFLNL